MNNWLQRPRGWFPSNLIVKWPNNMYENFLGHREFQLGWWRKLFPRRMDTPSLKYWSKALGFELDVSAGQPHLPYRRTNTARYQFVTEQLLAGVMCAALWTTNHSCTIQRPGNFADNLLSSGRRLWALFLETFTLWDILFKISVKYYMVIVS